MSAKRACLACRAKKTRCVPASPRCVRCTDFGIQDCVYNSTRKRGVGNTLGAGGACANCRAKKRKCDAGRPCTTCIVAKCASECVYDGKYPQPVGTHHSRDPDGLLPGERLGGSGQVQIPTVVSSFDATRAHQASRAYRAPHPPGLALVHRNSFEQRIPLDSNPSISIVSPFMHRTIPSESWIPQLFLGEERLQVQSHEVDATDLDMKCRLWALRRLPKFGIHLDSKELEGLIGGDQSSTASSVGFVHWAHSIGMLFSPDTRPTPSMVLFYVRRAKMAWEHLVNIIKNKDYRAAVRALMVVVSNTILLCMTQTTIFYIQKGCELIKAGNLRFVPTYGHPPEFSEDLHKALVPLSQTIYWANYLFLTRGVPDPGVTADLEQEFLQELPQVYPILFDICPLMMRTQAILLIRDAILFLSALPADGVKLGFWRQSCDRIVAPLEVFSQKLLGNVKRFREHGGTNAADVISSSCIACLAHRAVLYEVFSRTDPVAGGMYSFCDSALQSLGMLTSELFLEEYTHFDLLLGDSWRKSLSVFDARIGGLPPEESESLQHFRRVVGEKYSDFQIRLPGRQPPLMFDLALLEDEHPNLMSPEVRMEYGL